jgi:hypothetical protein
MRNITVILNLKLKVLWILLILFISFLLVWCGSDENNKTVIYIPWYQFDYNWNIGFQKLPLRTDDSSDIISIYQEEWENLTFRDSLLVAEKYSNWVWVNAFVQNNLEYMEWQWLTISNINKKQIWLKKKGENIYAVLVEYEITEWLISEIPSLYVSQLFIPDDNSVIMMSYITESSSSRSYASDMFKNIN